MGESLRFGLVMESVQERLDRKEKDRIEAEAFDRQFKAVATAVRRAGRPAKAEKRNNQICYFATDAELADIDSGMRIKGCSSRAQYIRFAVFYFMTFHQKMSLTKFL